MQIGNTENVGGQPPLSETPYENPFPATNAPLLNLDIAGHPTHRWTSGRGQTLGRTTVSGVMRAPAEDRNGLLLGMPADRLSEGVLLSVAETEPISTDKRLGAQVERLRQTYRQVLTYIDRENPRMNTEASTESGLRVYPVDRLGVLKVPKSERVIRYTQAKRLHGLVEQMTMNDVDAYRCTVPSFREGDTYYPILGLTGVESFHKPKFHMIAMNGSVDETTFIGLIPVDDETSTQNLSTVETQSPRPIHISVPLYEPGLMSESEIKQHIADKPSYTGLYMLITPITRTEEGVSRFRMFGQLPSGELVEERFTHYPALTIVGRINDIIEKNLSL